MSSYKIFEVIFILIVFVLLFSTFIYAHSTVKKCSIDESARRFKLTVKEVFKALFKKDKESMINIRIGANENGYMSHDVILLEFTDLIKEFRSLYLNKMPIEYENYIEYSFIAISPINISSDDIDSLIQIIKAIVEKKVKESLIATGVATNVDVNGFVAVAYNVKSGRLNIAIAKNQRGIYTIGNFNISTNKRNIMNELKSLEKKEMTEEWNKDI